MDLLYTTEVLLHPFANLLLLHGGWKPDVTGQNRFRAAFVRALLLLLGANSWAGAALFFSENPRSAAGPLKLNREFCAIDVATWNPWRAGGLAGRRSDYNGLSFRSTANLAPRLTASLSSRGRRPFKEVEVELVIGALGKANGAAQGSRPPDLRIAN